MRILSLILMALLMGCAGQAGDEPVQEEQQQEERGEGRLLWVKDGVPVFGPVETTPGQGVEVVEEEPSELGQARQPLVFAPAGATNPGFKPDTHHNCSQHFDPNQQCIIPDQKDFIWHLYGGTTAQKQRIREHLWAWYGEMVQKGLQQCSQQACWQFGESLILSDPSVTHVIGVSNLAGDGACVGSVDTARGFFCWSGQTTVVPKDNNSGLVGTYYRYASHIIPVVNIDIRQIDNLPGLTDFVKDNVLRNIVRAAALSVGGRGLMNLGNRRCNNIDLVSPNTPCLTVEAEACHFNGFGDEGGSILWIGGANCGT